MPPVLSKGGAASKLSATEPASVWAPSPETNCQQTEIKVSQWDETNTQEGRRTLKDTEQVGSTPTSEHYCGYATPKSRGWVVHPILMSLPKSLSAFRNCNVSFNVRQNCLLLLKDQQNGPWLCFQGKLYDWNILTLDCWAVYIFIICFLFCPVVPFEHIQVNISPARSRSFFPIVPWILRSGVSWLSILDMKHVLAWLACKNKFESSQEFSVKQFPL